MLLPLWEGFDEAYHYGYVQFVSTHARFPVMGEAKLSREIWHAFELAPVSHYLQPFTKAPTSFDQYFKLPRVEREARRARLDSLPASEKFEPQQDKGNYEVNQSPLSYLWMAAWDRVLASQPIIVRVLWLRLLCSIPAIALLAHATLLLARQHALSDAVANFVLFCVFSSQMLYGTICHVCNDWLAVPLFAYFIWAAIRAWERMTPRAWAVFGLMLAAALLAKAYFLVLPAFAAMVVAYACWRQRVNVVGIAWFLAPVVIFAGPWYIRNLILYGSFSAKAESAGMGAKQLLDAAIAVPWAQSIAYMAHSSLWTGNNSFTTFSSTTLNLMLTLLAVCIAANFARKRFGAAASLTAASILFFCAALAYVTVAFYAASNGDVWAAVPWYMPVLLVPVMLLAFRGATMAGRAGSWLTGALVMAWGYLLAATYLLKLLPMYAGFEQPRVKIGALWSWYVHGGAQRRDILDTLCLANPTMMMLSIADVVLLDVALAICVLRQPGTASL